MIHLLIRTTQNGYGRGKVEMVAEEVQVYIRITGEHLEALQREIARASLEPISNDDWSTLLGVLARVSAVARHRKATEVRG